MSGAGPGQNEMDQIQKIHNILGTPNPELLAKFKRNASHMDFNFPEKKGTGIERLVCQPMFSRERCLFALSSIVGGCKRCHTQILRSSTSSRSSSGAPIVRSWDPFFSAEL
eukprot:3601842-Amphidinium_carterae.1